MAESVLETDVLSWATADGWFCRKVKWIGRTGAPDRLFVKRGRHVWIELKDRGEEPTPQQYREIARMKKAGCEVYWTDKFEVAVDILCGKKAS